MSASDGSSDSIQEAFRQNGYLQWLEGFTIDETIPQCNRTSYRRLLYRLWDIPWEGVSLDIGNDYDRIEDGLNLRRRYEDISLKNNSTNIVEKYTNARVLEVLIALSMHIYDLMQDTNVYNSVSRWFWEMIGNVGLDCLDDYNWTIEDDDNVEEIVTDILQRKAKKSWFLDENWHDMEVWYQMHEYLSDYF